MPRKGKNTVSATVLQELLSAASPATPIVPQARHSESESLWHPSCLMSQNIRSSRGLVSLCQNADCPGHSCADSSLHPERPNRSGSAASERSMTNSEASFLSALPGPDRFAGSADSSEHAATRPGSRLKGEQATQNGGLR